MSEKKFDLSRLARLACLEIGANDVALHGLREVESWMEEVRRVDTEGVLPMTSPGVSQALLREDEMTDGNCREGVLANAPDQREGFFVVPKVIE